MTRIAIAPISSSRTIVISVVLENKTDLLVGGGALEQMTSPIDIPVAKIPIGDKWVPYIPASTLKGMLRSLAEEYLRASTQRMDLWDALRRLYGQSDLEAYRGEIREKVIRKTLIQFIEEETINDKRIDDWVGRWLETGNEPEMGDGDRSLLRIARDVLSQIGLSELACYATIEGLSCELPAPLYKIRLAEAVEAPIYPCPVCQTFGAPGLRSRVTITHALPLTKPVLLVRRHVAIDRLTGAAAEAKLFDVEYLPPGHRFLFYILLHVDADEAPERLCIACRSSPGEIVQKIKRAVDENRIEDVPIYVLALSLKLLVLHGAWLGRRKSAGYGRVVVSCDYTRQDLPPELLEYLDQLEKQVGTLVDVSAKMELCNIPCQVLCQDP